MSHAAAAWAWEQELPSGRKLVLLALAEHANPETGECFPGQKFIARRCGMDERSIRRHLEALEEAGLIARTSRHRANGSRTSDVYSFPPLKVQPDKLSARDDEANRTILQGQPDNMSGPEPATYSARSSSSEEKINKKHPATKKDPAKRQDPGTEISEAIEYSAKFAEFYEKRINDGRGKFEFERWVAYHVKKGDRAKSWDGSWRTWVLNKIDFSRQRESAPQDENPAERQLRFEREREALRERRERRKVQIHDETGIDVDDPRYRDRPEVAAFREQFA